MKKGIYYIMLAGCFYLSCSKSASIPTEPITTVQEVVAATPVIVYTTLPDGSKKMFKENNIAFNTAATANPLIDINTTHILHNVDGLGLALTGSSAYLLKQMTQVDRTALLQDLFTTSGINLSIIRLTIGASDFSTTAYTYDDMPAGQTDGGLANFNLNKNLATNVFNDDYKYVIPILKEILQINPNIYIMASPWSAPAWMKRNDSFYGTTPETDTTNNQLKTGYVSVFANYIVKYLQAMQLEGITINAITVQNEPRTINVEYPTMYMSPGAQIVFIRDQMRPKLTAAGFSTKIFCGDNNWSGSSYETQFMADAGARAAADGSAFHGYGGTPDVMSSLNSTYPNEELHFTEFSDRTDNPFSTQLGKMIETNIIGVLRNYSRSVILWNLALNENSGPNIKIGGSVSRPVVTVNSGSLAVTKNVDYYVLAHASKFLRSGAKVIGSTNISGSSVYNVVFQNPDGWKTAVVYNKATTSKTIDIKNGTQKITYAMPAGAIVTFNWL